MGRGSIAIREPRAIPQLSMASRHMPYGVVDGSTILIGPRLFCGASAPECSATHASP